MKKTNKIILSILAGIDAVIYMFTPIIISAIWINITGLKSFGSYLFYILGLLATIFRAYKIGWMK
jgi:hypothetical protein